MGYVDQYLNGPSRNRDLIETDDQLSMASQFYNNLVKLILNS